MDTLCPSSFSFLITNFSKENQISMQNYQILHDLNSIIYSNWLKNLENLSNQIDVLENLENQLDDVALISSLKVSSHHVDDEFSQKSKVIENQTLHDVYLTKKLTEAIERTLERIGKNIKDLEYTKNSVSLKRHQVYRQLRSNLGSYLQEKDNQAFHCLDVPLEDIVHILFQIEEKANECVSQIRLIWSSPSIDNLNAALRNTDISETTNADERDVVFLSKCKFSYKAKISQIRDLIIDGYSLVSFDDLERLELYVSWFPKGSSE